MKFLEAVIANPIELFTCVAILYSYDSHSFLVLKYLYKEVFAHRFPVSMY